MILPTVKTLLRAQSVGASILPPTTGSKETFRTTRRNGELVPRSCLSAARIMHFTWTVKASNLCNLRCGYCYEWPHLADPERIPLAGWARIIAAAKEYHTRQTEGEVSGGGDSLRLAWWRAVVITCLVLARCNRRAARGSRPRLCTRKSDREVARPAPCRRRGPSRPASSRQSRSQRD